MITSVTYVNAYEIISREPLKTCKLPTAFVKITDDDGNFVYIKSSLCDFFEEESAPVIVCDGDFEMNYSETKQSDTKSAEYQSYLKLKDKFENDNRTY